MNRFDDIVARLPTGVNFYRLLEARPGAHPAVATILSHAPALAEQLGAAAGTARRADRRERLRAGAGGRRARRAIRPRRARGRGLPACCSTGCGGGSTRRRFALGVQLIVARTDPIEAAEGYARVAEAAIHVLADATVAEFETGARPGAGIASCSSSASAGSAARR